MAKHIPFLFTEEACDLTKRFYPDSEVLRVSLPSLEQTKDHLPHGPKLWLDPGFDGYHWWPEISDGWFATFAGFPNARKIATPSFQANPNTAELQAFAFALLDECSRVKPDWLTVPQFPAVGNSSLNRICRHLAKATAKWAAERKFKGKLILPLVVTHQDQANKAVGRNRISSLAKQCYEASGAAGYWVVDSTLEDWTGSQTFVDRRFKGLLALHEKLADALPEDAFSIAGPYWALNLVLWARQLTTHPAIGVGGRYRYTIPGRDRGGRPPKRRVALPALRRTAVASRQLDSWLKEVPSGPAYSGLRDLAKDLRARGTDEGARAQLARFYRNWYEQIANVPEAGRALALFQDFSSAYVLGKPLGTLPADEKTARRPERVAEQFMLFCMPSS